MAQVQTVLGPVDAGELGKTLIHEHFRGRDVPFLRRLASEVGLQIVACTGIYTYDHLPINLESRDADFMADLFVHDIEQGIQGTEAKAAFIKCAADEAGVNENIEKIHRAAARASVRTGAPIMAHSRPASETGPRQVEIFVEEGVDPAKIQIAHCGDTDDLDYLSRMLDTGVWLGMDRYGIEMYLPADRRNATVMALLFEQIIPQLREGGMTDDQLNTMMVDNPRRWLAGE